MIANLQLMPLAVYLPLWTAWALACGLLRWKWIASTLLFAACFSLSVLAFPWPLHVPAVLPPAAYFAIAAFGPILAAGLHRRRRGGNAKPTHGLVVFGASAMVVGSLGVLQMAGRDSAVRPHPERVTFLGGRLSADGSLLSLGTTGTYPTLGGREGAEISSWLVDTSSGALLQDGWRRCQYSFADAIEPGLVLGYARPPRRGYWSVDPQTGSELLVADSHHKLEVLLTWRAKVQDKDGTLEIRPAGQSKATVLPWNGPAPGDPSNPGALQQAPELGVLYYREADHLVRHDALRDVKTPVVRLPEHLPEKGWSWALSPLGQAIQLHVPGAPTRLFDAHDGREIATLPERWWLAWTQGPSPFAIARPPRRNTAGVRLPWSPESLWIGPAGARPVQLPHEGHLISSQSGRLFLAGDGITELHSDGTPKRTLKIQSSDEGSTRPLVHGRGRE